MERNWKPVGLVFILVSLVLAGWSRTDTAIVNKVLKADTAAATVKTLTIKQLPTATLKDTVIYVDGGVCKKGTISVSGGGDTVTAGTGITVAHVPGSFKVSLYQLPAIVGFTNNHTVNYVGQTVSSDSAWWSLTGNAVSSQTITGAGSIPIVDRNHKYNGLSISSDWTIALSVDTGTSIVATAYTYVTFYVQKFYGTSAESLPTAANIQGGTSQWVQWSNAGNRVQAATTIVCSANYPYYSYPLSWGEVALTVGSQPVTWLKDTVSVTSAYSHTENYIYYVSPNKVTGTISLEAKLP